MSPFRHRSNSGAQLICITDFDIDSETSFDDAAEG
jgi:hypothetical protein